MWCSVQECRGPAGEQLKRPEWSRPVEGDLSIYLGRDNFVATLEKPEIERRLQVLYPLFDVRAQTFAEGILVVGYRLVPQEGRPTRECRQAWYCLPAPRS